MAWESKKQEIPLFIPEQKQSAFRYSQKHLQALQSKHCELLK